MLEHNIIVYLKFLINDNFIRKFIKSKENVKLCIIRFFLQFEKDVKLCIVRIGKKNVNTKKFEKNKLHCLHLNI